MIIKIEITLPKNNRELRDKIAVWVSRINVLMGNGYDDTDTKLTIDTSFEDE